MRISVIAARSARGAEMSVSSDARVVTSAAKAATNVASHWQFAFEDTLGGVIKVVGEF
jgi:hypothetical protein